MPPTGESERRRTRPGPPNLKTASAQTIASLLLESAPTSRAELARRSGLSKPTVWRAVDLLQDAHLIEPAGHSRRHRGRAAVLYRLRAEVGWVVGVDLSGELVRVAVSALNGRPIHIERTERDRAGSARAVLGALTRACTAVGAAPQALSWATVTVDQATARALAQRTRSQSGTKARNPTHRTTGRPDPAIALIRKMLGPHYTVGRAVSMAALAEYHRLSLGPAGSIVYLCVGPDPGLGLVLAGRLHTGSHRLAGVLDSARLRAAGPQHPTADPAMSPAVGSSVHLLRRVTSLINPTAIVFGGSAGACPSFVDAVRQRLDQSGTGPSAPLQPAALGDDAAVLGAAAFAAAQARQRLFQRIRELGTRTGPGA
ncbi:ROK family protein [Actinomadura rubrisoli]|uniref:ROK family protein n=1 Tax=Actinomadura rubrisoli TaxID=2530368 RepID=A0A4R5BA23_9ACTN|nr:ROK family protein [Actinomadura rubrisoli]TDD81446.1 ROK family protein [Actinomadura rubrisoli]